MPPPLKLGENIFLAIIMKNSAGLSPTLCALQIYLLTYLLKIRAFFVQNHVKFGNFVNFLGKYNKKLGYFL